MAGEVFQQRLIVQTRAASVPALMSESIEFSGLRFEMLPLFAREFATDPMAVAESMAAVHPDEEVWLLASPESDNAELSPWDWAHLSMRSEAVQRASGEVLYIEPDIEHQWIHEKKVPGVFAESFSDQPTCTPDGHNSAFPDGGSFAWHLDDRFSQLASARSAVGEPASGRVRAMVLDTGYDPNHITLPKYFRSDLQKNFVENNNDARDLLSQVPLGNPGHGTGVGGILAGNDVSNGVFQGQFNGFLGGAPFVDFIPVRIARSVVHFYTSGMAEGIRYAIAPGQNGPDNSQRADVVSISMGGLASKLWAKVVNEAYEKGVVIVAAAGNNFGGFPTKKLVYPARFNRVIAACGAMADQSPYIAANLGQQGNYGPPSAMRTAMAAYTPNTTWAEIGCDRVIDRDGSGTSSATPQIAAAAALWLQQHGANIPRDWRRVESVRKALFDAAEKGQPNSQKFYGNGILRANDALQSPPPSQVVKEPEDKVSFFSLGVLFGAASLPNSSTATREMLSMEALQTVERSSQLQDMLGDGEGDLPDAMNAAEMREFAEALREEPAISNTMRGHLDTALTNH